MAQERHAPLLSHDSDSGAFKAWPPEGSWLDRSETFMSNSGAKILLMTVYGIACALTFQYGFHVAILQDYQDMRRYITPIGRGCGVCLDMNCALLLLPMCRALQTWLRSTWAATVVPFDDSLGFHKVIAYMILLCTTIHGIGQGVNYYLYYKLTPGIFGLKSVLITGLLLVAILVAIVATSMDCMRRRRKFEVFYYVHHLFPLFYLLLVVHGLRHGKPTCWMWIVGPFVMYMVDRMYRTCSSFSVATKIVSCEVRSSSVIQLAMAKPFNFRAGQYCELKVPCISKSEWHPFTISSGPDDAHMTFTIKAIGNWTKALCHAAGDTGSYFTNADIMVKGPFGAPAEHFGQFDDVVMISSGIGATPFVSVCKDIAATRRRRTRAVSSNNRLPDLQRLADGSPCSTPRQRRVDDSAPFDWRHPRWPFAGHCGCSPIRVMLEQMESGHGMTPLGGSGGEEGALRTFSTSSQVLRVWPMWLKIQRVLRTVTVQMSLIFLWLATATMAIVIVISSSAYYWTCILLDKLHTDIQPPNWAAKLEEASEYIFIFIGAVIVLGIVVDMICIGCGRFWQIPCLWHQIVMVVPGCLVLFTFNAIMSWRIWHPPITIHYVVIAMSKLMLILPLFVRVKHLTGVAKLVTHRKPDISRLRSVGFYWVNRHAKEQSWALPDLARLELADGDGLFNFHMFVTRPGDKPVNVPAWNDYELANGVQVGRPKWASIFRKLHDSYPAGSTVGVFFCGSPALAKVLQQLCAANSSSSVMFRFKKENF